jgi:hypothetical protein
MASERQIRANRANARASTGPKSAAGKTCAARNALRHGLAIAVIDDAYWATEVEVLARRMAVEKTPTLNSFRSAEKLRRRRLISSAFASTGVTQSRKPLRSLIWGRTRSDRANAMSRRVGETTKTTSRRIGKAARASKAQKAPMRRAIQWKLSRAALQ